MRALLIIVALFQFQIAFTQRPRALPDFVVAQYAGSIGFMSGGIGYNVMKNHQLSVHYGYVPENRGGNLNILAGKLIFNIYSRKISDRVSIEPLKAGAMISYHFGSQFGSRWPAHRYPDGYYWWKTSLRTHILTQTAVTAHLKGNGIRSVTFYLELNTNELYLISLLQNRNSLRPADIIKVGCGVRGQF